MQANNILRGDIMDLTGTQTMPSESIKITESKLTPWIVCFSAALFFFYEFIQMNMFNSVSADLMKAFSINATQLGNLSSIYFYSNLLFLSCAGLILDRFSTRKVILTTLTLCIVGIGSFALTSNIGWAYVFRFMSGIGSAFCFLSSIRLAARWFEPKRMALVSGLIVTMAMTGGTFAQAPLTYLVEAFGWRHALLIDAALGMVIAGIIFALVRDYPEGSEVYHFSARNKLQEIGLVKSWRQSYLNLQNWSCGIYTSMMNLPIALLGAIWGKLYLVQTQAFSNVSASYITSMLFMGAIVGSPFAGWVSDLMRRRLLPMRLGILFSHVLIFLMIFVPGLTVSEYLILFFLMGFVTSTQVISYPLVTESNPKILTATSVSVVSFCAIGGYALFQPLFGWILDLGWQGKIADNVHVYSPLDYHHAIFIIPIGFTVAFIATFFMRETKCSNIRE